MQLEKIAITEHARMRLLERGISIEDVSCCLDNGIVIRNYDDDKRLPSCLILGYGVNGKPLHIVVSKDDSFVYLITAYWPDTDKWNVDFSKKIEDGGTV